MDRGSLLGDPNQRRVTARREGVAKDSATVTYVAIKFYIDNWRWEGVPFYLRSGKRLAKAGHRDRHSVQAAALLLFKSQRGGRRQPQRVGHAHSAG